MEEPVTDPKTFHVTVKGLVFDDAGRLLCLREPDGVWDLPGGRLERGESFAECLERECREEIGVRCTMKERSPRFAWPAVDRAGIWRLVVCFEIGLDSLEIRESEECAAHGFFAKPELAALGWTPQMRPLLDWLEDR